MKNKIAMSIKKIMPDEASQEQIFKQALARANAGGKENQAVKIKSRSVKRIAAAIIAAALTLTLFTYVGFAYGSQVIQLLGGGRIEMGTVGSESYVSISVQELNPVEIIDGRVYFILDGVDITDYCTESTFYKYEHIAENGYLHIFIVGGNPDSIGWSEFIWDANGNMVGSTAQYHEDEHGERPEWLRLANETLQN
jgi:hypothetical protein